MEESKPRRVSVFSAESFQVEVSRGHPMAIRQRVKKARVTELSPWKVPKYLQMEGICLAGFLSDKAKPKPTCSFAGYSYGSSWFLF